MQSCAAQLEHPGNKTKSSRARPKDRTPPARAARPLEPPGAGLTPGHFCVFQRAKLHCPCVKKQANLLESRYTYTRAVVCCGFWFMSQQPNRNFTLSLDKKSFSLMSNQLKVTYNSINVFKIYNSIMYTDFPNAPSPTIRFRIMWSEQKRNQLKTYLHSKSTKHYLDYK